MEKQCLFTAYVQSNLLIRIFAGLILGVVLGLIAMAGGFSLDWLKPFGSLFISLLKMIVMPIILTTLVVGVAGTRPVTLGKAGGKVFVYYLATSAFAVSVGLIMANIFKPGKYISLTNIEDAAGKVVDPPALSQTLLNIVPTNPFASLSSGAVLPTIFFAILLGIAIAVLKESEKTEIREAAATLERLFQGGAEVMYKIVHWILQYAPIGVFALIAVVFASEGPKVLKSLVAVLLVAFTGYIIHFLLVHGAAVALIGRLSYLRFLKKGAGAITTAFVTRSSSGTLPVSMDCVESMGVKRNIYSFTLPLGATINMDGTAIYLGVCTIFIAEAIGLDLTLTQQLIVVLTAVFASIGTAGVPGAGAIMLVMVLSSIGVDLASGTAAAAAYAMILGIDALLDMGRTALNVNGDMVGSVVVAKSEDEFDKETWDK